MSEEYFIFQFIQLDKGGHKTFWLLNKVSQLHSDILEIGVDCILDRGKLCPFKESIQYHFAANNEDPIFGRECYLRTRQQFIGRSRHWSVHEIQLSTARWSEKLDSAVMRIPIK